MYTTLHLPPNQNVCMSSCKLGPCSTDRGTWIIVETFITPLIRGIPPFSYGVKASMVSNNLPEFTVFSTIGNQSTGKLNQSSIHLVCTLSRAHSNILIEKGSFLFNLGLKALTLLRRQRKAYIL